MQYIKKVNKIEAIQNRGDVLNNVIPFLNERGIPYKYTESFLRGRQIGVITNRDSFEQEEYSQLNAGDYLVINKGVISIMSAEDFESKYQLSNEVLNDSQQKEIDELKSKVELLLKAQSDSFDGYSAKKTLAKSYENSN